MLLRSGTKVSNISRASSPNENVDGGNAIVLLFPRLQNPLPHKKEEMVNGGNQSPNGF